MKKEIGFNEFNENAFKLIGQDMILIVAQKDGITNTMTASWGGIGIMWGVEVAYIFIRPTRYTKEFIDNSSDLSLCVLPENMKPVMSYLGKVSGRDENKIKNANLTLNTHNDVTYFNESRLAFICEKLYCQVLEGDCFIDKNLTTKFYPLKDYHTMYVVKINSILVEQN